MKKINLVISKIVYLLLIVLSVSIFVACEEKEVSIQITSNSNKISEGETIKFEVVVTGSEDTSFTWDISHPEILSVDINHNATLKSIPTEDTTITITVTANADSSKTSSTQVLVEGVGEKPTPKPPVEDVVLGIVGPSEVRSEKTISLSANVSGTENKKVTWNITEGSEFATIDSNGNLTANATEYDHNIQVTATSAADPKVKATKNITVVGKPILTQAMLDEISEEKIAFDGFIQIDLYTSGIFEKLYQTYTTPVKTAMDGTNWYAEYYNGDTGTQMQIYYKNSNDLACQVGVSLMNEDEYFPMLDEAGNEVSWEDAGLYNSFRGLKIEDFAFNEKTWRYEYVGGSSTLVNRVIASANPYDFKANNFSLIIEEGMILGIHSSADPDYSIAAGYKAMQQLFVTINFGDIVEVPTISKYSHDDIHDELEIAIKNMQELNSYTLDFKEQTSTLGFQPVEVGFTEIITPSDCYFSPYSISYDLQGQQVKTYTPNSSYGFKKINDGLYNSYSQTKDGYIANRAYESDFSNALPTFAFAPEIFREYYVDEIDGSTTYYVDSVMSIVASTFYYGVGNDINLYGIFATATEYFTGQTYKPYVVVKDGYIVEAGFYFFVGSIYGVVEIEYSDFNNSTLPSGTNIEFETRYVPTKWEQLEIFVSSEGTSTTDDVAVNALDYLKEFYGDEEIGLKLPFFGDVIGDTYGFGLTTMHLPSGGNMLLPAIMLYYDVPLDLDYTIDSSIQKVNEYLIQNEFTYNPNGWYQRGDICVSPTDSSLDFVIYIWKAQ